LNNASIKNKLRKDMRAIRQAMDIREIDEKSEIICGRILSSEEYKNADIILAYMSAGGEVDLQVLIDAASSFGKSLFIPKVISKEEMRFYKYTGYFTKGSFGIKEPVNTSQEMLFDINKASAENKRILVLVPGVAFDVSGNRMGYGG
jgi:5-formyltetrahydrofolate cyclo-ligase